jgi:hypothetical protein
VGDLFLGSSRIHPTMLGQQKSLSCTTYHGHIRVVCIKFLMQDVHRFVSPRLSDMSNHLSQAINM